MPGTSRVFGYPVDWLSGDLVAGLTLAAYAIPVSLAYATLAGLPPQVGIYGYVMGGIGYALAGSSRYLAVGPTSAISLMIAATVGNMAGDDLARYAQIATGAAIGVGVISLIAWACRLSVLVKLISDSVLTGFKAGAGLTIALTQLPALLGVAGGGHSFPERLVVLVGQVDATNLTTLGIGVVGADPVVVRRAMVAWAAGRASGRRAFNCGCSVAGPYPLSGCGDRSDPRRSAIAGATNRTTARPGGHHRARDGMHAAGLYRRRGGRTRIRDQAPPDD